MEMKDKEEISLKKIIIAGVRRWKVFVLAGCISLIPAILYLLIYPKTYEVRTIIKFQEDKDLGSGGSMGLGDAAGLMRSFGIVGKGGGSVNMEDEIAVLRSNKLFRKVVLDLGLDVSYEKPFSMVKLYDDDSPVKVVPDSVMRETLDDVIAFSLKIDKNGAVKIKMKEDGKKYSFSALPADLALEKGNVRIFSQEVCSGVRPVSLDITISPAGWVAEDLIEVVGMDEFSKNANSLEMVYQDHNRLRGKKLLETLVDQYNKFTESVKQEEGRKSMTFLEGRINDVISQLQLKEREIEKYKLANNITDVQYDVQFYAEAIKTYREKIIELEAQSHMIELLSDYLSDPENKYNVVPSLLSAGEGEGGPVALYNEALMVREKMIKSSSSINPLSEVADSQLDKLRNGVFVSIENARKSIRFVTDDLKSREKEILDKIGNVPVYEREYVDLKRQQEILQGVYLVLLQKKEEIALSLGSERVRGFLTEPAYVASKPVAPRKLFAAIFMVLFTMVVPVVCLYGKKQLKDLIEEYKKSEY